jgi:hypothetical protein
MKRIQPRPIAPDELAVLEAALQRAAVAAAPGISLSATKALEVVGECECGCRSLYFRPPSSDDYRIADGTGLLASGTRIDLMVWASGNDLAALEIVNHAGEGALPVATTVSSWEHVRDAT